jgi:hypothetical protein
VLSFRIGYIHNYGKIQKISGLLNETIGHIKLDTALAYVNKLSDQEERNVTGGIASQSL